MKGRLVMQGKSTFSQKSGSGNRPIYQSRQPSNISKMNSGGSSQPTKLTSQPEQRSKTVQKKPQSIGFLQGCLGCLGFTVLLGIVVIVLLNIFADNDETSKSNVASTGITATSKQGINDQVSSLITSSVGNKTNNGENKIIELQVNDHSGTVKEGDKIVIAKLHGNDNLSSNMIKSGMQLESIKIFKQLFQLNEIEEVDLIWQFPVTDSFGSSTLNTVLKINISRTTASKINWDNFDKDNFAAVADSYWEHPSLSN